VNELLEEIESLKAIIAGLQQQLLRIGNQEGVLKAAYLEGQMAKKQPSPPPVKLPERDMREKVAKWMVERSYATGHGDTVEDLLKELEWQVAEREREACRLIVLDNSDAEGICCTDDVLEAFRQRGEK